MRIAQLAPLMESVPPSRYGGTERVVATLTDELVRRGHEVTLFATGDSRTKARLVPVTPRALRPAGVRYADPYTTLALGMAFSRADEFDVIHSHLDHPALLCGRFVSTPVLHTLHGRLDLPEIQPLFNYFTDAALASISDNQRRLVPHWNWLGTVYNGIEPNAFTFHPRPGSYLAFLGRIAPEKGIEDAVEVARIGRLPLKVAAKVDPVDREYYESRVRPLFAEAQVEFIGEITEREKDAFLGQALALLFPIRWPEPFGMVMVEAMATGTPVIAGRFGSVPEVVDDGVTGFICDSVQEMALACGRAAMLDRSACRARVEERFTPAHMAGGYEALYRRLIETARAGGDATVAAARLHADGRQAAAVEAQPPVGG